MCVFLLRHLPFLPSRWKANYRAPSAGHDKIYPTTVAGYTQAYGPTSKRYMYQVKKKGEKGCEMSRISQEIGLNAIIKHSFRGIGLFENLR